MSAQAVSKIENHLRKQWPSLLPLFLGAIVVAVLSGAVNSPTQDLHATHGSLGQAGYVYYHSEQGLRLMILHNATDLVLDSGAAQAPRSARWFYGRGSSDGQPLFDWELEVAGGRARFRIDGAVYDLAQGTLFLIRSANGEVAVKQLQHDLTTTSADSHGVARFAAVDPVLSDFTHGIAGREARR